MKQEEETEEEEASLKKDPPFHHGPDGKLTLKPPANAHAKHLFRTSFYNQPQ